MDILLDDNNDLILNGDLKIKDTGSQEIDLLLRSSNGHWRQSPEIGVDIITAMRSSDLIGLKGKIISELELDGFANIDVQLDSNGIPINISAARL